MLLRTKRNVWSILSFIGSPCASLFFRTLGVSLCLILVCIQRVGCSGDGGSSVGVSVGSGGGVVGRWVFEVKYGLVIILFAFTLTTGCG